MDKNTPFTIISMMKAAQWERAKGELRALAFMQGAYPAEDGSHEKERWYNLHNRIEAFVKDIHDHGLHE